MPARMALKIAKVCTDQCRLKTGLTSYCGDNRVDRENGEECDDGNQENGDSCDANCRFPACGNGIIGWTTPPGVPGRVEEVCDDGNTIDGDDCSAIA